MVAIAIDRDSIFLDRVEALARTRSMRRDLENQPCVLVRAQAHLPTSRTKQLHFCHGEEIAVCISERAGFFSQSFVASVVSSGTGTGHNFTTVTVTTGE